MAIATCRQRRGARDDGSPSGGTHGRDDEPKCSTRWSIASSGIWFTCHHGMIVTSGVSLRRGADFRRDDCVMVPSDRSGAERRVGPAAIGCKEAADRRADLGARRERSAGGQGAAALERGCSFRAEFSKVVTPIWNRMAASHRSAPAMTPIQTPRTMP